MNPHVTPEEAEPIGPTPTGLEDLMEQELLSRYADLLEARTELGRELEKFAVEVERRLRARNATTMDHARFTQIEIESKHTYDQVTLGELKGLLPPERLKDIYTPAWDEKTVLHHNDDWNANKVRGLVKLGGQVREVIERARKLASERLVVKLKPPA